MEAAAAARRLERGQAAKRSDFDSEDDGSNLVSLGLLLYILEMEFRQGIRSEVSSLMSQPCDSLVVRTERDPQYSSHGY